MGSERSDDPTKRGGRKQTVDIREFLNAIFYVLATGCQWKALPKDLPPKRTAHSYFMLWERNGTLERFHDSLYVALREAAGKEPSPSVAVIDSQSSKAAKKRHLQRQWRCSPFITRIFVDRDTTDQKWRERCGDWALENRDR
jgi:transposase